MFRSSAACVIVVLCLCRAVVQLILSHVLEYELVILLFATCQCHIVPQSLRSHPTTVSVFVSLLLSVGDCTSLREGTCL